MRAALAVIAVVIFAAAWTITALPALATSPVPPPMVFFGANRTDLSPQGMDEIKRVAWDFTQKPRGTLIRVIGHTDTAEQDHLALSQRRADAVKEALVRDGIPATAIVAEGKGDSDLLVATKKGVDEPENRRVVIVFIRP